MCWFYGVSCDLQKVLACLAARFTDGGLMRAGGVWIHSGTGRGALRVLEMPQCRVGAVAVHCLRGRRTVWAPDDHRSVRCRGRLQVRRVQRAGASLPAVREACSLAVLPRDVPAMLYALRMVKPKTTRTATCTEEFVFPVGQLLCSVVCLHLSTMSR